MPIKRDNDRQKQTKRDSMCLSATGDMRRAGVILGLPVAKKRIILNKYKQPKTKLKIMSRSKDARNFQLTLNGEAMDYYEETVDYLKELGANYLYSCIEEHKKLTLHIHIYVQFEKHKRLSYKKTHGAHVEVCGGTPKQNMQYIEKMKRQYGLENILEEFGVVKHAVNDKLAISLMEMELEEVPKHDFKVWKEVKNIKSYTKEEIYKPQIEVIYIYGESNTGKSKKVFEMLEKNERFDRVKYANGFWIGVNQLIPVKTCWYDDFRDSQMPAAEFINFIDYYKNQMNIKYSPSWVNQYERIFITSIQSPHEIYKNLPEETREQWIRRLKIIHKEKL